MKMVRLTSFPVSGSVQSLPSYKYNVALCGLHLPSWLDLVSVLRADVLASWGVDDHESGVFLDAPGLGYDSDQYDQGIIVTLRFMFFDAPVDAEVVGEVDFLATRMR